MSKEVVAFKPEPHDVLHSICSLRAATSPLNFVVRAFLNVGEFVHRKKKDGILPAQDVERANEAWDTLRRLCFPDHDPSPEEMIEYVQGDFARDVRAIAGRWGDLAQVAAAYNHDAAPFVQAQSLLIATADGYVQTDGGTLSKSMDNALHVLNEGSVNGAPAHVAANTALLKLESDMLERIALVGDPPPVSATILSILGAAEESRKLASGLWHLRTWPTEIDWNRYPLYLLRADFRQLGDLLARWPGKDDGELLDRAAEWKDKALSIWISQAVHPEGTCDSNFSTWADAGRSLTSRFRLREAAMAMRRVKTPKKRRRYVRTPTTAQIEALKVVGECQQNFAEAGRRLKKDPKTVRQLYEAGLRNAGRLASKFIGKPITKSMPVDRRGQVAIDGDRSKNRG